MIVPSSRRTTFSVSCFSSWELFYILASPIITALGCWKRTLFLYIDEVNTTHHSPVTTHQSPLQKFRQTIARVTTLTIISCLTVEFKLIETLWMWLQLMEDFVISTPLVSFFAFWSCFISSQRPHNLSLLGNISLHLFFLNPNTKQLTSSVGKGGLPPSIAFVGLLGSAGNASTTKGLL